jgi:hypothetical protein
LETFALPDVMALLAATRKTGELRVVGGRIDGRVQLDAGRVVSADVGRADSFVDAVFELLRLSTGKFSFDGDTKLNPTSEPVDIEPLLLEASARLTEWRGIEAVVPSLDHAVRLVADLGDPHVTLGSEQWRMVVAVAGARCVHDVADRLGLGEYGVCKSLKELVEAGVVLVDEPSAASDAPAKAEPKPEPVAEQATPEPEPEPVAEAPAPEPETAPEPAVKAEHEPPKPKAKVAIEPERKPEPAVGKAAVPALTTKDQTSPIPPGEEPGKGAKKPTVTPSQAKSLVSQLAALGSEKMDKPAAKPETKADKDDDNGGSSNKAAAKAETQQAAAGERRDERGEEPVEGPEAAGPEGGDAEEPLNRGLLLKFLSSVRQ